MTTATKQPQLIRIARTTGIWYLIMAISGVFGFLIYHSEVYTSDPQQTLTNLIEGESLARTRLLFELGIIISQALTAIWFYRLFKDINRWAALATGIWGTVNSVVILVSAIAMGTALEISQSSLLVADKIVLIELLSNVISNSWGVGGLFFGLWLLPMGYIITSSKRMPVWLGRTLIIGGVGYVISTILSYAGVTGSWLEYLTAPATIGEFWIIGYLLIFGIRPSNV